MPLARGAGVRGKTRSALALTAGTVAVAAIAVLGVASLAGAQTSDSGTTPSTDQTPDGSGHPHRPALTDDQRQCLADHGVTPPTPAADGTRTPPTDDQRAAFRAAVEACGLPVPQGHPGPGLRPALTDDQRQCLADHGVTPPTPAADGTRSRPTDDQRAAFRAAAQACGVPVPSRGPGAPGGLGAMTTGVGVNV